MHYEQFADGTVKCIENEIPFDIPDSWAWCRITVVSLEIFAGGDKPDDFSKERTINHCVPIYSNGIENNGLYGYTNKARVSSPSLTISARGTIGYCCIRNEPFFPIVRLITIVPVGIDLLYLKFVFETLIETGEGSSIPQLTVPSIKPKLIPVPPLNEQVKIASMVNNLFNILSKLDSNKKELVTVITSIKSKILDLAICGKLVPQDPNDEPASVLLERIRAEKEELIKQGKIKRDKKESVIFKGEDNSYYENLPTGEVKCIDDELPFDIPEGWEWCNLSMLGTTNIGLTYKPTDIDSTGTVVLRSCNIVSDRIDYNDLVRVNTPIRGNQYVQKNDILICARNGSKALVGKCAIIPDLAEPTSFGAFMAIYRTKCYSYIIHFLRSQYFRSVFFEGNSTTINQLTQDMLKRAVVPFPPKAEQNRIVSKIQELYSVISEVEAGLN